MLTIELLYFDGCPSWQRAWTALGEALATSRVDAMVRLRNIDGVPQDQRQGFAGSPTLRLDGRDLEGYAGPTVYACRRYLDNDGRGWPDPRHLRRAIETAATPRSQPRPQR